MIRKILLVFVSVLCVFILLTSLVCATPVTFSNIEVVAIRGNSVVIRWDTDIASTGQVEYGTTASYGNLSEENGLSYWQQIEVTGLTEGTEYHFRIKAKDYEGNETISGDSVFTTRTQIELDSIVMEVRTNHDLPKVYYVKTDGNDSLSGLSIDSAWQHPSYATQLLEAGDTLYILEGTWYDEHCVIANSGIETHPITLTAYNGIPTLDGMDETGYGIYLDFKDYIEISHLTIRKYYHTIYAPGSYIHILDCALSETGGKVVVISQYNSTHNTIENCTLYDSGWNTIQMLGNREPPNGNGIPATHITIRNCTIYNSTAHAAIDLYGNFQYVTIEGNELYSNPSGCIYDHDDPDHREYITILDNYFHDTESIPINIGMDSYFGIYNNTFETIYLGGSKTNPIYIYENSHDFEIHNNNFYDCGMTQIVGGYNFTFDENYIHSDGDMYASTYGTDIIVKNPLGYKDIYLGDPSSTAELLFDNGTVFTADYYWLYSYVPVRYYPDKSNTSGVAKIDDWGTINTVTIYPITLRPTIPNEYLSVSSVNEKPDTITVESTVETNPTTIGYTNIDYANCNVILIVDGVDYNISWANESGTVFHNYNGDWAGGHTFTWKKETSYVNEPIVNPELPISYSLSANFPNPFRSSTKIMYSLPVGGNVEIVIYNVIGQKVRTLVSSNQNSGYYRILWDGMDDNNQSVSGGIYFYRLIADNYKAEKKMILIR